MPNIALVLREEIMRLARKEIRAQTSSVRKLLTQLKSTQVELKKTASELKAKVARLERRSKSDSERGSGEDAAKKTRFNSKGIVTHRTKLGISAADYGKLVGVTGQTIYKWEQGTARPREAQLTALASVRGLGKREATARLEQAGGTEG